MWVLNMPLTQFQSTLSVRRATLVVDISTHQPHISIHALREESDSALTKNWRRQTFISIHALREESDGVLRVWYPNGGISIHALREESDQRRGRMVRQGNISIHALREESDPYGSPIKIGIRGIRGIRDKEGLM